MARSLKAGLLTALVAATATLGDISEKAWATAERHGRLDFAEVCCVADSRLASAVERAGGQVARYSNWNGYDFEEEGGDEEGEEEEGKEEEVEEGVEEEEEEVEDEEVEEDEGGSATARLA